MITSQISINKLGKGPKFGFVTIQNSTCTSHYMCGKSAALGQCRKKQL
jgi:hypothetical protein